MSRYMLALVLAVMVLASSASRPAFAAPSESTFVNPLFKGGDPWVTRVDGVYDYSASHCGVADICLKQSRTLTGLANAPWIGVWTHSSDSAPNAHEIWAPELHHLDGRWYIYYAADDGDNDHHRLYVLSADSPDGPFVEADTGRAHGRLQDSSDHWAIDPDVFTAADGKLYLTWSCTNHDDSRFPQRICLARMRDPTHVGSRTVFISTPTEAWETRGKPIQEGPVGYTRDGRTYITYSASASWIANDYAVGLLALARGASPLNASAWHKSGPIFDHHGKVYGPGSVVFVPSPDGTQYWNIYHAIDSPDCAPAYDCRDIRMQPMHFDARGAPVLGQPVNPGVPLAVPSGEGDTFSPAEHRGHWVGAWMAAMIHAPVPANAYRKQPIRARTVSGQTLRQMVRVSAGGRRVRIRLSNTYGDHPLSISAASVGLRASGHGDDLIPSSLRVLHFHGRTKVTIPAGTSFYSDAVKLAVHPGQVLGVSLYIAGRQTPATWHVDARQTGYLSKPGNHIRSPRMPVQSTISSWDWLSGVDVWTRQATTAIVALGDSITNGYRSSSDANQRYPDSLSRRLLEQDTSRCSHSVLDAGIDGNEVAAYTSTYGNGPGMLARFDRDVLGQAGVKYVLVLGGINDIGEPTMVARKHGKHIDAKATAEHVIHALHQIILKAHAAGLKVFGATLTPFKGTRGAYSPQGETARETINAWIRQHAAFDDVIDFDAATRDPAHPLRLRPVFDSGGHLHPDDAGYRAMARAIPLELFGCRHVATSVQQGN